jgi:prophage regulatory protein
MKITTGRQRILRMPELVEKVGLKTSTIYAAINQNDFPSPVRLFPNGRAIGWLESEIDTWILQRKEKFND